MRAANRGIARPEGVPFRFHEKPGCIGPMNQADLFSDLNGELTLVWPRGDGGPDVDYAAMACPHAEQACATEDIWIPQVVMLSGPQAMEEIIEGAEKVRDHVDALGSG